MNISNSSDNGIKEKDIGKISIIIPCYNVVDQIDRCLRSVTNQSVGTDKLEIICVDDRSDDGTVDKLLKWEERFPENIMVIKCDENRRQGAARNTGLDYSTGQYVTFIDSDDWVEPDYIEKLAEPLMSDDYDMVIADYIRDPFEGESPRFLNKDERSTGKDPRAMLIDSDEKRNLLIYLQPYAYSACYKLVRRSMLVDNNLYFPEEVAYEDTAWGLFTYLYVKKAHFVELYLYHYYVKDDSTVLKMNAAYHRDMLDVQKYKLEVLKA